MFKMREEKPVVEENFHLFIHSTKVIVVLDQDGVSSEAVMILHSSCINIIVTSRISTSVLLQKAL